jgi:hypothetical protein
MERTKKMLLVDPESLERFQNSTRTLPENTVVSKTLDDMSRVLNTNNISDAEKWQMYQPLFQRFLHFIGESRKPFSIEIQETGPETEQKNGGDDHNETVKKITLTALPKAFRRRGEVMFDKLLDSDLITWDRGGTVSIRGEKIEGSSITDLINDSVRNRVTTAPEGWQSFSTLLGDMNMPHELIGNTRRKEFIRAKNVHHTTLKRTPQRKQKGAGSSGLKFAWERI